MVDITDKEKRKIGEGLVTSGSAVIPIQMDSDIANGEYIITAEYSGDDYYSASSTQGIIRVGYSTRVHVPTMYVWDNFRQSAKLKAHIYMGSHQVNGGNGQFFVDGGVIDNTNPTNVISGHAYKIWNLEAPGTDPGLQHTYGFHYNGNLSSTINPGQSNTGNIYFLSYSENPTLATAKTDYYPVIECDPIVAKPGETVTVTARVIQENKGYSVNPQDTAYGEGTLYYGYADMDESEFIQSGDIQQNNGYSTFQLTIPSDMKEGSYDFKFKFVSNDINVWASGYGATSLFVVENDVDIDEPSISIKSISFDRGEQNAYIQCTIHPPIKNGLINTTSSNGMAGKAFLYLDDDIVPLTNAGTLASESETGDVDEVDQSQAVDVAPNGYCEFRFKVKLKATHHSETWWMPGEHYIRIEYFSQDGVHKSFEPDAKLIIRRRTRLSIDNSSENDGIIYIPNNGDSTSIRVSLEDQEEDKTIVSEGTVLVSYERSVSTSNSSENNG